MSKRIHDGTMSGSLTDTVSSPAEVRRKATLLKAGALQKAIFNRANFSSMATDANGVIIGTLLIWGLPSCWSSMHRRDRPAKRRASRRS